MPRRKDKKLSKKDIKLLAEMESMHGGGIGSLFSMFGKTGASAASAAAAARAAAAAAAAAKATTTLVKYNPVAAAAAAANAARTTSTLSSAATAARAAQAASTASAATKASSSLFSQAANLYSKASPYLGYLGTAASIGVPIWQAVDMIEQGKAREAADRENAASQAAQIALLEKQTEEAIKKANADAEAAMAAQAAFEQMTKDNAQALVDLQDQMRIQQQEDLLTILLGSQIQTPPTITKPNPPPAGPPRAPPSDIYRPPTQKYVGIDPETGQPMYEQIPASYTPVHGSPQPPAGPPRAPPREIFVPHPAPPSMPLPPYTPPPPPLPPTSRPPAPPPMAPMPPSRRPPPRKATATGGAKKRMTKVEKELEALINLYGGM